MKKDEVGGTGRNKEGGGKGKHKILFGKPEGKRPHGKLKRRWEYDIIKTNLKT